MMVSPWTIFTALVVISAVGVVTFLIHFINKTGRNHSAESASASPSFFEDPNSLQRVACPSIFDPAEKYISLIIPAFNEEHRLPGALEETINYLQQRAAADNCFSYEVVIVDDGSNDRTPKIAFDFVRKHTIDVVRVILLRRNYGKGEAIRKGMLHSRGELLLMLDADGATKVTDLSKLEYQICKLAEKGLQSGAGASSSLSPTISNVAVAAFGSRAHLEKQALATRKWYRNFLMKGFHLVVLLTAGPGIRDTQCGFKMFTRAAARKLFTNIHLKRWCFDVEIVYLSKRLNIPMIEIMMKSTLFPSEEVKQYGGENGWITVLLKFNSSSKQFLGPLDAIYPNHIDAGNVLKIMNANLTDIVVITYQSRDYKIPSGI